MSKTKLVAELIPGRIIYNCGDSELQNIPNKESVALLLIQETDKQQCQAEALRYTERLTASEDADIFYIIRTVTITQFNCNCRFYIYVLAYMVSIKLQSHSINASHIYSCSLIY
jgi:hypothetical protein